MDDSTKTLAEGQLTLSKIITAIIVKQSTLISVVGKLIEQDEMLLEAMCQSQGIDLDELRKEAQTSGDKTQ